MTGVQTCALPISRDDSTGAFVNVCVPLHILLVVVPKPREIAGFAPPVERTGYVPVTDTTPPADVLVAINSKNKG